MVVASIWRFPVIDQAGNFQNVRIVIEVLFQFAILAAFIAVLWQENRWVSMFVALAAISSVYPMATRFSTMAFRSVMAGAFWYFFLVHYVKVDRVGVLLDALCIIALFHLGFALLQRFGVDPLFSAKGGGDSPVVGLMTNPNELSTLFAFCFPAFFRARWIYGLPLVFVGLILAKSTGGMLAVAIAGAFYLSIQGYWYLAAAFVAVGCVAWLTLVDTPTFVRLQAWKVALKAYPEHWLMGGGIGHWKWVFKRQDIVEAVGTGTAWRTAHNEFIQGIFEMGIGFALIVLGYFTNIARRLDARDHAIPIMGLVVVVATSLVSFPFHIATTAMLAVTWLAILEIELRGADGRQSNLFTTSV